MKRNMAYFLGISSNWAFAAGNVALGLNKYCKNSDYDIVIYYSDLEEPDKTTLQKIPHCILKQFKLEDKFVNYMINELPEQCRFKTPDKLMCFLHYEAFDLLEKYKYVVWLDADILIQDDISNIIEWGPIGFSADEGGRIVADQFAYRPQCKYNLEVPAIKIGLMVLSDVVPYKKLYQFCYDKTWEYAKYLLNPEQAIINLLLQEFKLQATIIPEDVHCVSRKDMAPVTQIVHFGTAAKVWNNDVLFDAFPEWYRNHKKWLELGGTENKEYKLKKRLPRNLYDIARYENECSFLYDRISRGSNIIIYGGGLIGRMYLQQIKKTGYCNVIAVLDKNADKITDLDSAVMYPEKIKEIPYYDYVLITIEDKRKISEVKKLLNNFSVPEEKVVCNEGKS